MSLSESDASQETCKKYGALFSVAYDSLKEVTELGDLYRIHKLIVWAGVNRDFKKLLKKNELLETSYDNIIAYYAYIDFLDLNSDNNINERKMGIYRNMILTCIRRFPNGTEDSYKETVKSNLSDFISEALK